MTKTATPAKKPTEFGKRLQKLRAAVRPAMSSRELDALAGLKAGHSRHLERNDKDKVSAFTVLKLAEVFDLSMDLLYAGKGRLPPANDVSAAVNPKRTLPRRRAASET
jgi:hypothetical protein